MSVTDDEWVGRFDIKTEENYFIKDASSTGWGAIIGCVGGLFGIVVILAGLIKAYHSFDFHCKGQARNVIAKVQEPIAEKDGEGSSQEVVAVSWEDPQRSAFQNLMCLIRIYKVYCRCCNTETTIHFANKDTAKIKLPKYHDHKLQVNICYTGRIIQADHWSGDSDANGTKCFIRGAPKKPTVISIGWKEKQRIPVISFTQPVGDDLWLDPCGALSKGEKIAKIFQYTVKCKKVGSLGENMYPVNFKVDKNRCLASFHYPFTPGCTYEIQLSAVSSDKDGKQYNGEWSNVTQIFVPEFQIGNSYPTTWTKPEWEVLTETVVECIGNAANDLSLFLGLVPKQVDTIAAESKMDGTYFKGIMTKALLIYKKDYGSSANLVEIYLALKKLGHVDLAEYVRRSCDNKGIQLVKEMNF